MSKTLKEHVFIHSFRSGNTASVVLRIPPRGWTFRYQVHFAQDLRREELPEYRHWQKSCAQVVSRLVGRSVKMTDDCDRPANRRETRASVDL